MSATSQNPSSSNLPNHPSKPLKSRQEIWAPVFGKAIQSFDEDKPPTKGNVVSFWLNAYDKNRDPKAKMNEQKKNSVINLVVDALASNLERNVMTSSSSPPPDRKTVFRKVKGIVLTAEKLMKSLSLLNNPNWIQNKKKDFIVVFEIVHTPRKAIPDSKAIESRDEQKLARPKFDVSKPRKRKPPDRFDDEEFPSYKTRSPKPVSIIMIIYFF